MRRREFIMLIGGAAATWPLAARAQQREKMRRIGVLMHLAADDPEGSRRLTVLVQGLQQLGWTEGRNARLEIRWAAGQADRIRKYAEELVALAPEVIVAPTSPVVGALQQATRAVPIVFVHVVDPVGAGYVASLARPSGNTTGFTAYEYSLSGKWLELLKEIAPGVTRAAVIRDPATSAGIGQFSAIRAAAALLRVELTPIGVGDGGEIERDVAAFARSPNGGLIVTGITQAVIHRNLILTLAGRYKLPAVYYDRLYVYTGGLVSF